jgi:hypothetical protein
VVMRTARRQKSGTADASRCRGTSDLRHDRGIEHRGDMAATVST